MINRSTSQPDAETTGVPVTPQQRFAAKWMRIIGNIEGVSLLLLLFVAMPLKYLGQNPILVQWLGPIHGGLFLLYLAFIVAGARILNWRWFHVALAFGASTVPFGPFLFEAWLRRTLNTRI